MSVFTPITINKYTKVNYPVGMTVVKKLLIAPPKMVKRVKPAPPEVA